MEPVTSQRVSTKRIQTKLNKHMLDLSQQPPLNQRKRHCLTEKKRAIKTPLLPQTNITSWRIFWMGPPWTTMTWTIQVMPHREPFQNKILIKNVPVYNKLEL